MATGSTFCAGTDSRSSDWSSCMRGRMPTRIRTTSTSRPNGRVSGRQTRSGSPANVADAPPAPPLLLASTSPQRQAILEQLHIPFDVVTPEYEEQTPPDADPL